MVQPVPTGYAGVTPYLIIRGAARALDFYKKAFGATELMRFPAPGGKIGHAEMKIGDSVVMMADESPEMGHNSPQTLDGTPVSMMFYVADVDAQFAKALAAGGVVKQPLKDQFYGDRSGRSWIRSAISGRSRPTSRTYPRRRCSGAWLRCRRAGRPPKATAAASTTGRRRF